MTSLAEQTETLLPRLGPDNAGYGLRPLPDPLDEELSRFVAVYLASSPDEREALVAQLTPVHTQFLTAFGERMASFAQELGSPTPLRDGLVALGIAAARQYHKEIIPVLALIDDSARELGSDPAPLFADAAAAVTPPAPDWLLDFPARPEEFRTPEAMGYEKRDAEGGLRYHRTW